MLDMNIDFLEDLSKLVINNHKMHKEHASSKDIYNYHTVLGKIMTKMSLVDYYINYLNHDYLHIFLGEFLKEENNSIYENDIECRALASNACWTMDNIIYFIEDWRKFFNVYLNSHQVLCYEPVKSKHNIIDLD